MSDDPTRNAALDPRFFNGRLLIDILSWDWSYRLAIGPRDRRLNAQLQGGIDRGRDFRIDGRVRAPAALRGKTMRISLSPFGPKVRFDQRGLQDLGRVTPSATGETDFEAIVRLPEADIPSTAACLATIWRHVDIWTFDPTPEGASIDQYSFSAKLHPNVRAWADGD